MDNPIEKLEHLPKNQKLIALGGAVGLGGLLWYRSRQKAAAQAAQTDTSSSSSDGGAISDGTTGTQDGTPDTAQTSADPYMSDEGIYPYTDPYGGDPSYGFPGGGAGYGGFGSVPSGGVVTTTGAGDVTGQTQTAAPAPNVTVPVTINEPGLTGGGAPHTDPNKHSVRSVPIRSGHGSSTTKTRPKQTKTAVGTTHQKSQPHAGTTGTRSRPTKTSKSKKGRKSPVGLRRTGP